MNYSRIGFSSNGHFLGGVTHDENRLLIWNVPERQLAYSSFLNLDDLKRRIASQGGVSTSRGNEPDLDQPPTLLN